MSVPVIEKNWQFNVNIQCGGKSSTAQSASDFMIKVKDALVGFPSGHWSVLASSDGTTADLTDNWDDYTALTWSTGAHAWIVLENSATGMQFCFDCNTTSVYAVEFITSYVGQGFDVSSPSTTARPTAAHEIGYTNIDAFAALNAAWVGYAHVMMSDDGECTRFIQCHGGNTAGVCILDAVKDPIDAWTTTQWFIASRGASSMNCYNQFYLVDTYGKGRINGNYFRAFLSTEGYNAMPVGEAMTAPDAITGEWPMTPVGLCSTYTARQGRKGALYDIWFGPKSIMPSGETFPADGTRRFANFGYMVFPWNGTVPKVL